MHNNKAFFIIVLAVISIQTAISQNNTNSPYTRFGYGEISDNTSGEQRAMGGVAIGARSKNRINTVNPASYSVSDSLTFMFDMGALALLSSFSDDASRRKNTFNANLEYLTIQFRLFKGVGVSAGILPYSFAGYNFYTESVETTPTHDPAVSDSTKIVTSYSGTGGINQFYGGLSFDLFNHLSLGANIYYMFGTYNNNSSLTSSSSYFTSGSLARSISVNNIRFRFGAQFYNTFAEKHELTLGAIYEHKMALRGEATETMKGHTEKADTLGKAFETPLSFGAGLYYKYDNKFSVGIDYTLQQWGDALFYGTTDELVNRSKLALGLEYQPNYRGRKFGDRIMYRLGANMSNPYYTMEDGKNGQNFGITFGIGFPLASTSRTMLNMSFEYGKIGASEKLKEDYFKFTFNFSLAETWFFKRKL